MFNFKAIVKQALLVAALAFGAGSAVAGPIYHVSIDTTKFAGTTGFMDLTFSNFDGAAQAVAHLSAFQGDFGSESVRDGNVSGAIPAALDIENDVLQSFVQQNVSLGGIFKFDISFSGAFETLGDTLQSVFTVALLDSTMSNYLGADQHLFEFVLSPGFGDLLGTATPENFSDIVKITAVPEPSDMLLVLTGLGLVAFLRRRESNAAR